MVLHTLLVVTYIVCLDAGYVRLLYACVVFRGIELRQLLISLRLLFRGNFWRFDDVDDQYRYLHSSANNISKKCAERTLLSSLLAKQRDLVLSALRGKLSQRDQLTPVYSSTPNLSCCYCPCQGQS